MGETTWPCPHCGNPIGKITITTPAAAGPVGFDLRGVKAEDWPKPIDPPPIIQELAKNAGGTIDECALLPDGSGFATMPMPLPKDHWLFAEGDNIPPMPFRMGTGTDTVTLATRTGLQTFTREQFAEIIRAVGKYAYRANTENGKYEDQDPDSFLQNLVVGLLGYNTPTGLSADPEANPKIVGQDVPQCSVRILRVAGDDVRCRLPRGHVGNHEPEDLQ